MRTQNGDTLIEVLLAMVVLSLMIVGAITMMSRGLQVAEVSIEHTQVRTEVNAQAEMLRYLRDNYQNQPSSAAAQEWAKFFSGATPYANATTSTYTDSCSPTQNKKAFYVNQNLSSTNPAQLTDFNPNNKPATFAQPGQGLWIEATTSPAGLASPAYLDFQIRACWAGPGSDTGTQKEGTTVRLYEAH